MSGVVSVSRKKVAILLQSESAECGLAALAMILTTLGRHTSVRELRGRLDPGRDGVSLADLAQCARSFGFEARGFRAGAAQLSALPLPAVLGWRPGHFVVLESVKGDKYSIVDPAQGRREVDLSEFLEDYTGVALTVTATPKSERIKRPRGEFFRFVVPYIPNTPGNYALLAVLSVAVFGLGLVPAFASQVLFDGVRSAQAADLMLVAGACLPIVISTQFLAAFGRSRLTIWLEIAMDRKMIETFMFKLMALPYKFFLSRRRGDILVRVGSTAYIRDVLSGRMITAVLDVVFVLGYLAVIVAQAPSFSAPVVALAVLQLLIISIFSPRLRTFAEKELAEMSTSQSMMLETLNAVETVKSFGLEQESLDRWSETYRKQLVASVNRRRFDALASSIQGALVFGGPLLLTLIGVRLVALDQVSVGQAIALVSMGSAALSPVGTLGSSLQALQTVRVHLDRLGDVMSEKPEDLNPEGHQVQGAVTIDLKNIGFRYSHNGADILQGFDLTIRPGENVAIVGPSGSGKSTLARIMIGLLRPESGNLVINGHDVEEISLASLRRVCGIVTQNSEALSGSLESNVSFGRRLSDEAVWRALEVADLALDIARMPLGVHTPLGESGMGLSGGQLQRLAIARAVADTPSVLVMDEATSHLDAATEARVVSNLGTLGCTRIVIAHRLSTVKAADKIILLDKGKIQAAGSHEQLLQNSVYQEFFDSQLEEKV